MAWLCRYRKCTRNIKLTRTNKSFTHDNFISKMFFSYARSGYFIFVGERACPRHLFASSVEKSNCADYQVPSQRVSCLHEEFNLSRLQPERLLTCEAGRHNRKGTVKYPAATCDAEQEQTSQASLVLTFEKLLTEEIKKAFWPKTPEECLLWTPLKC